MKNADKKHQSGKRNVAEGVVRVTSRGIGFFEMPEKEKGEEIKIEQSDLSSALDGDFVRILLKYRGNDLLGEVVDIVTRAKTFFVGTVRESDSGHILEPQNPRMYRTIEIPKENLLGARVGEKVVVKITKWGDSLKNPVGIVTEVLGQSGENETELRAIVSDKGLSFSFPKNILDDAEKVKADYPSFLEIEKKKRRDFRKITTFTIDPDDAKDFDDALSIQKLGNGNFEIGIHIADVSAFVKEKSALDREAAHRSTSIYLVDRTISMFPEVLSNDLCSLNESEEKLTFSVILELSPDGHVQKRSFAKTIIHSDKRFTYADAQKILRDGSGPFAEELKILNALALKIRVERVKRGVIEFDQDEIKFELDARGKPLKIFKKERLPTHKLIEDFMILANSEVAHFMASRDKNIEQTFIYRVHDLPNEDRMKELMNLLQALGHRPRKKENSKTFHARDINQILEDVEGKAHKDLVHMATLRAMAKAVYSTKNVGHFGLSLKYYTHFTSPIRRYPDVLVHRLLFKYLSRESVLKKELEQYEALSRYATQMEIAADDAQRASIKYKQAEYMANHVGKTYAGTITGVTERGIFVREEETFAEGMIPLRDIKDDYYILDKTKLRLVGRRKRKTFSLGDKLKIRLKKVSVEKRLIDYELVS